MKKENDPVVKVEKIITRTSGVQVKMQVFMYSITGYSEFPEIKFGLNIFIRLTGSKKWNNCFSPDSAEYRRQSFPEGREAWVSHQQAKFVSANEVYQLKLELWDKIRPRINDFPKTYNDG